MAKLIITQSCSYRYDEVHGTHDSDGGVVITLGTGSLTLTQDEWKRIRSDIENGISRDARIREEAGA